MLGPSRLVTQKGNIHDHSQHHPIAHREHTVENKAHPFPPEEEYHASTLTTSTILFLDPPPFPISPALLQYPLWGYIYFHFRKRKASEHSTYWKLQPSRKAGMSHDSQENHFHAPLNDFSTNVLTAYLSSKLGKCYFLDT